MRHHETQRSQHKPVLAFVCICGWLLPHHDLHLSPKRGPSWMGSRPNFVRGRFVRSPSSTGCLIFLEHITSPPILFNPKRIHLSLAISATELFVTIRSYGLSAIENSENATAGFVTQTACLSRANLRVSLQHAYFCGRRNQRDHHCNHRNQHGFQHKRGHQHGLDRYTCLTMSC